LSTVCNRVIEITPNGLIDRKYNYDEYLENAEIAELRKAIGAI
jgi:ATPase subunit of ABC transporter with duplicated ATPase domains